MFRYYRTLLVFISLTFFIQVLYSIVKLQIRKQQDYYGTLRNTLDKALQQLTTSILKPNNATVILSVRTANHVSITNNAVKNSVKYKVNVSTTLSSYTEIERKHRIDIHFGGHWYPSDCQPKQRLAIIICYRQREQHFKMFLNHMHLFLWQQKLDYTIIVVNQHGNESFNRGALFNVGFIETIIFYPFSCFIFHDVDLLPEDLRNICKCDSHPKHM
ncbi:unnamed protein product [Rotaria magnacalcarata]|uniref:Galactosyltransferase N-terminal domain-containing protein n=1 Tax=Rotaria magnacalcarata TaxID=392030 RepID=A0A8S2KI08_9BILA|nr:unnamed protein product [Rotaria magnacalcarata]